MIRSARTTWLIVALVTALPSVASAQETDTSAPLGAPAPAQSFSDDAAPAEDVLEGGPGFEPGRSFTPAGVPDARRETVTVKELRSLKSDRADRRLLGRGEPSRDERRWARSGDRRVEERDRERLRQRPSSWKAVDRDEDDDDTYAVASSSRGWTPATRAWTGTLTSDRTFTYVFTGPDAVLATPTSLRVLSQGGAATIVSASPKVIDVETTRLDRRVLTPGQIEVSYGHRPKIIRLGPPLASDVSDRPGDMAGSDRRAAVELEPWSVEWERTCAQAHRSFEPETGTYALADGRRRFCTGD